MIREMIKKWRDFDPEDIRRDATNRLALMLQQRTPWIRKVPTDPVDLRIYHALEQNDEDMRVVHLKLESLRAYHVELTRMSRCSHHIEFYTQTEVSFARCFTCGYIELAEGKEY